LYVRFSNLLIVETLADQMEADGGQKIIPQLSRSALESLVKESPKAISLLKDVITPMLSPTPSTLGCPSDRAQANYYPGERRITRDDLDLVSKVMEDNSVEPENTRVTKTEDGYNILQASTTKSSLARWDNVDGIGTTVRLLGGDHCQELSKICGALIQAKEHATNDKQREIIAQYVTSFLTGSLDAYRESQKVWVTDRSPNIEMIFGFVEPYRDPHGVRAEWESIVCISDPLESSRFKQLVDSSDSFIRLLPWAVPGINNGKGPFEKELFEAPDFVSVHGQFLPTMTPSEDSRC